MKQLTASNGRLFEVPESVEEATDEYNGFTIEYMRPPVPPGRGIEWSAIREGYEEEGGFHSDTIAGLQEQIDEYWTEVESEKES